MKKLEDCKNSVNYAQIIKSVVTLMVCVASIGCVSEEVKQSDQSEKPIIKFKLMTGEQYPLCKDYVDMLNMTVYAEFPICERKILSNSNKFSSVEWVEVSDKNEIRRVRLEGIKLHYLNNVLARPNAEKNELTAAIHKMDIGEYPRMYTANIDMDHDGRNEVVYKFISQSQQQAKYQKCTNPKSYVVIDNVGEIAKNYEYDYGFSSNDAGLFYYEGRVYQDYWTGLNADFHLKVNEISGIPNQVCGVNITQ